MQRGPRQRLAALLSILAVPILTGLATGEALASPSDEAGGEETEQAAEQPKTEQPKTEQPKTRGALERADDELSLAVERSRRVQQWLREARAEKQTARVRCLDRKLSRAHAIERRARSERDAMARIVARGQTEWLALHENRLGLFVEQSRVVAEEAYWCGRESHRRRKLPTTYQVRVIRPPLPSADRVAPSSTAAAWR